MIDEPEPARDLSKFKFNMTNLKTIVDVQVQECTTEEEITTEMSTDLMGIVLFYDFGVADSLKSIKEWSPTLNDKFPNVPRMVIGASTELHPSARHRKVTWEEGNELATALSCPYFEVSRHSSEFPEPKFILTKLMNRVIDNTE